MAEKAEKTVENVTKGEQMARPGLSLTKALLDGFFANLRSQGRAEDTISGYRRHLRRLMDGLPLEKTVDTAALEDWRDSLLAQSYAPRTVNGAVAAVNSLLRFAGRRDLQLSPLPLDPAEVVPELTRNEYLRLLQAARRTEKERTYLLVKLFGTIDLPLHALPELTLEAVRSGWAAAGSERLRIPPCFQAELLAYCRREGILSGPVFRTYSGTPLTRTHAASMIQRLARDARVAPEKCNPRCLRKLCLETQAGIRANIELLAEQAYDRLLENEQLAVGWDDARLGA